MTHTVLELLKHLSNTGEVVVDGIGLIRRVASRGSAQLRNPVTGELMVAKEKKPTVKFTPGRALQASIEGRPLPTQTPDATFDEVIAAYDKQAFSADDIVALLHRRNRHRAKPEKATRSACAVANAFLDNANPKAFDDRRTLHTPGGGPDEVLYGDEGHLLCVVVGPDELGFIGDDGPDPARRPAGPALAAFLLDDEVRAIVGDDGYLSSQAHGVLTDLLKRLCPDSDAFFGSLPF